MTPARGSIYAILIALLILLMAGVPAVSAIQAALGDVIPLSGYSYGSQYAYLYLTGPNLPANGVMLNDITQRADQGQFTRVDVDGNDHWSYKWNTASVGGRLDEGTYTIWVVNGPNDRSRLSEADYGTISVTLGKPTIIAGTSLQSARTDTPIRYGSMEITSTPSGASVTLNDQFRGQTPLTISDLAPGTYNLTFTRFGYVPFTTPVRVEGGAISEVSARLAPRQDMPVVNTTTGVVTGPLTPAQVPAPTPKASGFVPAVFLMGLLFIIRETFRSR
jgi:hypothetical protein